MAHQSTGNVESPLEQSVVNLTTDVDASTPLRSLASGEAQEKGTTSTSNSESSTINTVIAESDDGGKPGGLDSGDPSSEIMGLQKPTITEPTRTLTPGAVEGDGDGEGSSRKGIFSSITKAGGSEGNKAIARVASVKKPASFKAVSINKHFLEKASSTGPTAAPSKLAFTAEKPSGFVQQSSSPGSLTLSSAKPRLVNRTAGFGLRDSSPGAGGVGSSGPGVPKRAGDAQRAVWTKNQPPPVVAQKELSDEELKRTYGIHLASRLQSDDVGKESKWADEDDDDDWMPETIEWNDGTKITLQHNDETPIAAVSSPTETSTEAETSSRKFGDAAAIESSTTEKPVEKLVQDTAAPAPRSSPWAPVPLPSNPSPFVNPSRPEPTNSDSIHSQSLAKEVPADDFNRSWRDRTPSNRELFNSETGQLEPVQERRNRTGGRLPPQSKPAVVQTVLQRPSQHLPSPAEPSPAFQQHRSSVYRSEDYRRRRTSSNVSGGSVSTGRRLSFNKGINHGSEHPISPEDSTFPFRTHPPPLSDTASPLTQPSVLQPQQIEQVPIPPTLPVPVEQVAPTQIEFEDPVARQQRVMKEARELARKRKQEEEEREEAAKKERLRIKLEQLEKQQKEKQEAEAKAKAEAEAAITAVKAKEEAEALRNKAPSPLPAINRTNQQSSTVPNGPIGADAPPLVSPGIPNLHTYPQSPQRTHATLAPHEPHRSPVKTYVLPANREPKDQAWKHVAPGNDRYTSWGPANKNQPQSLDSRGNPWGPVGEKTRFPALDGVGNGSYEANRYNQYARGSGPYNPNTSGPQYSPGPAESVRTGRAPSPLKRAPPTSPGFPRDAGAQAAPSMSVRDQQRAHAVSQWNSLPDKIQRDEAQERLLRQQERAIEAAEGKGPKVPIPFTKITEKWRKAGTETGVTPERVIVATEETVHEVKKSDDGSAGISVAQAPPLPQDPQRSLAPHLVKQITRQNAMVAPTPTRYPSRFFPESDTRFQEQPPQISDYLFQTRPNPPASPPPPTCPVLDSDGDRPAPIVHLPPAPQDQRKTSTEKTSPTLRPNGLHKFETRKPTGPSGIEAVQRNIQAMLAKQHQAPPAKPLGSPKPQDMPITSTTKPVLDDARITDKSSATVTLPPHGDEDLPPKSISEGIIGVGSAGNDEREFWTKPSEEGLLAELYVQDFGSQPTVKIPMLPSYVILKPAPTPPKSKKIPKVKPESVPQQDFFSRERDARFIPVRLPATDKTKEIPFNSSTQPSRPKKTWQKQKRIGPYREPHNISFGSLPRNQMHGVSA